MSGKQAPISKNNIGGDNQGAREGEAPPPYSGPSQSSQLPHQTLLPPQQIPAPSSRTSSYHQHQPLVSSSDAAEHGGWIPPTSMAVARSRAQRRFWTAFLWAWLIWIAIGLLIGGGISDVEGSPPGRRGHWDKHGHWRDDGWVGTNSWFTVKGSDLNTTLFGG